MQVSTVNIAECDIVLYHDNFTGLTMLEHRSIPRTPTEYSDPTSWDFSTLQRKK